MLHWFTLPIGLTPYDVNRIREQRELWSYISSHAYFIMAFAGGSCDELKGENREFKSTRRFCQHGQTRSDFAEKETSHVTDVKSQTSKLPIWRLL